MENRRLRFKGPDLLYQALSSDTVSVPISCCGNRPTLISTSDGVLCLMRMARAGCLSDKTLPDGDVRVCRTTVPSAGSGSEPYDCKKCCQVLLLHSTLWAAEYDCMCRDVAKHAALVTQSCLLLLITTLQVL